MVYTLKERQANGRLGAYVNHSRNSSRETTRAARAAFDKRFEAQVDPDGTLDPAERARRALSARKAYYCRLSLRSVQARRQRKAARTGGAK